MALNVLFAIGLVTKDRVLQGMQLECAAVRVRCALLIRSRQCDTRAAVEVIGAQKNVVRSIQE